VPARFPLAATLLLWPTSAVACQCDDPAAYSAKEIEERAQWLASRGFVIAEVERLSPNSAHDERYRVVRALRGRAPGVIRVDRFVTHLATGQVLAAPITSCDYAAPPGFKRVMAFTPAGGAASPNCSVFAAAIADETMRPAGMCAQYDLDHPLILKRVLELMAR